MVLKITSSKIDAGGNQVGLQDEKQLLVSRYVCAQADLPYSQKIWRFGGLPLQPPN